jgi:hypothetical protein
MRRVDWRAGGFTVTKTLERAFAKASRLSAKDQNAVARWLLAELESEARWTRAFRRSEDRLAQLADAALEEHRSGRTRRLGGAA